MIKGLGKSDRVLIVASAAFVLLCVFLLLNDDVFTEKILARGKLIGKISAQKNDTRHRSSQSLLWQKSHLDQSIHNGDALFTGNDSFAVVDLVEGGNLTVDKNSLVSFREIDRAKLANLDWGRFRVKVNGQIKIAVHGRVTTLEGKSSEVELKTEPHKKPTIRLLSGRVKVKQTRRKAIEIGQVNQVATLQPALKKSGSGTGGRVAPWPANQSAETRTSANDKGDILAPVTPPVPPPQPAPGPWTLDIDPANNHDIEALELEADLAEDGASDEIEEAYVPDIAPPEPIPPLQPDALPVPASAIPATPPPLPQPQFVQAQPPPEIPDALQQDDKRRYVWRLYDLYNRYGSMLSERADTPERFPVVTNLTWAREKGKGKPAVIEISNRRDFQNKISFKAGDGSAVAAQAYPNYNYWRVSYDGANWSEPETFFVETGFLKDARPQARNVMHKIPLVGEKVNTNVLLDAPVAAIGYVVEAARDEKFTPGQTRIFWSALRTLDLAFYKPGVFYYRFRAVSEKQELSEWSQTERFTIFRPASPPPPSKLAPKTEPSDGSSALKLAKVKKKKQMASDKGRKVAEVSSAKEETAVKSVSPSATPPSAGRKAAATASSETRSKAEEAPDFRMLNERYRNTSFSLQGFVWALQSSDQVYYGSMSPIASGLGLRAMKWWNHSGFEGTAKTQALSVNGAGHQTALRDLEARYHFRFHTAFPFHLARELQTSFFIGYENHTNSGAYFSNRYDLINFGTFLEFPVALHWAAGGEFIFGQGLDQSQKGEVTGHLSYFLDKPWSMSFGYRLHLFQAGSLGASAMGYLPYREGYTEAYSTLDYHF